jgi:hypothetical protein
MSRRLVFTTSILATAILFFTLGAIHARRRDAASRASYDAKLDAIRSEVRSELGKSARADAVVTAGTSARVEAFFAWERNGVNVAMRRYRVKRVIAQPTTKMTIPTVKILGLGPNGPAETMSYSRSSIPKSCSIRPN